MFIKSFLIKYCRLFHHSNHITSFLIFSLISISICDAENQHDHSHHMKMLSQQSSQSKSSTINYKLPNTPLVSSNGETTSLKEILNTDDVVILNFIFTTCTTICPIMSRTFSDINNSLNTKSVKMISLSIDPEYDTPEALRSYAKTFHAKNNWHFYTGSLTNMIEIQKAFNVFRGNKMNHSPSTFLRSNNKTTWIRFDGFANTSQIIEAVNSL